MAGRLDEGPRVVGVRGAAALPPRAPAVAPAIAPGDGGGGGPVAAGVVVAVAGGVHHHHVGVLLREGLLADPQEPGDGQAEPEEQTLTWGGGETGIERGRGNYSNTRKQDCRHQPAMRQSRGYL